MFFFDRQILTERKYFLSRRRKLKLANARQLETGQKYFTQQQHRENKRKTEVELENYDE